MMSTKRAEYVSCEERARQYPKGIFHADSGKLFCSCCNTALDHTRKGTIDRHLESLLHVTKKKASEEAQDKNAKKQATVAGMFSRHTEARDARNIAVFDLAEAFTAANIPLEKLDHPSLHSYLQNHIPNLGLLPVSQHLRTDYQQKVFENHKEQLKAVLSAASSVAIVTDEASDAQDRFGLHILFIPEVDTTSELSPAAYLADIVYLEKVNAVTVSQAVLTADKLSQYYRPTSRSRFTQPGLDFLKAVRVFDFKQVSLLPCDELIKKIPGADSRHVLAEFAAYKAMAGDVPSETTVESFWHASSDRFPLLSRLALRYLSVPTNSIDAERSVSQYTTVSAPQCQRLSTSNLANQVIVAKNSKTGIA